MADKAFITPIVFKWARESARISEESAAIKISVPVEKIKEWEEGISQPTIRQAELLAKAYKRPFALLFLPEIPFDFQPLQDFRRKTSKPLSTASVFMIREIQQKQTWLKDILEENNEKQLPFVGRFTLKDDPEKVANDILTTLGITPPKYINDKPIKEWINKSEEKGIFISRTSFIHSRLKLDSEEIQGFTIADPYAPFVFINSEDWNAPQLFTLVHELAHIWIAESGISNEIEPGIKHKEKMNPVELFCNAVAANALMPAELIRNLNPAIFKSTKELYSTCKILGVSIFAILPRALNLDIITLDRYQKLKTNAETDYRDFIKKEEDKKIKIKESKKGGPNYYFLLINKNGRLFTQIVLDAFHGGILTPTQASSLLNAQINNFPKLEKQLFR